MARKPSAQPAPEPEPEDEVVPDLRGHVTLPLDGQEFELRPSRKAIAAIERQTRPLFVLAQDAARGALSLDELSVIVTEMMRAYGEAEPQDPLVRHYKGVTLDRVADLIYEAGQPKVCARVMVVLTGALTGGYTAAGEAKAGTATPPTTDATPSAE